MWHFLQLNTGDPVGVDVPVASSYCTFPLQDSEPWYVYKCQKRKSGMMTIFLRNLRVLIKKIWNAGRSLKTEKSEPLSVRRQIHRRAGLKIENVLIIGVQAEMLKQPFYLFLLRIGLILEGIDQIPCGQSFRIRVEMKQISLRQESWVRLGESEFVGRELCCSTCGLSTFKM